MIKSSMLLLCILLMMLYDVSSQRRRGCSDCLNILQSDCDICYRYEDCVDENDRGEEIQIRRCTKFHCLAFDEQNECLIYQVQYLDDQQCLEQCCNNQLDDDYLTVEQLQTCYVIQQEQIQPEQIQPQQSQTQPEPQASTQTQTQTEDEDKIRLIIILSCTGFALVMAIVIVCYLTRSCQLASCPCCFINCFRKSDTNNNNNACHDYPSLDQLSNNQINNDNMYNEMMRRKLFSRDKQREGSSENGGSLCSICLIDNTDTVTKCYHKFHLQCLIAWNKRKNSCPNCIRKDIFPLKSICKECKKNYISIPEIDLKNKKLAKQFNNIQCRECKKN